MAIENVSLPFKLYCLTVMTLVAATYIIALRYTRVTSADTYFSTTAVCITEVIKLLISVGILTKESGSLGNLCSSLRENIVGSPKEMLKLSIPSIVYAVQNNMAFLALSNLDAAVYQVTYQLKIPCTALCTVLMLHRTLSKLQWLSVFMLCGGVTLVQWKPAEATKVQVEQNPWIGFAAVSIAVLCSGFAVLGSVGGLYTSVVVKYTDNIMKGFSAAAAIILSTVASVLLFGLQITVTFVLGTALVCISIYMYGLPRQDTTRINIETTDKPSKERLLNV
ncbi:CMP-sialic acid transporter isoform X2 [Protopterus annectens]|uniref:CMP-sialic acid transporter isoform X2 n=1 Tax=Protopterus annectens TaxID=7888 RepID=UPI001CFB6F26|nr:CMP-sialic acid transporter isoform X2 [Protopterus annectens]